MNQALELMTAEELSRCCVPDEEACFGSLSTARGHLPLEAMDIAARIEGLSCRIELRQTFVNNLDEPIEATYIFPLPDRAAVTGFRMQIADRVIDGVIKERGQARVEYNAAIQAGHQAAITEEERPGVFTMRVGNLQAGERAVVTLTMSGPLPLEEGDATFRFPLVVAPRYIPGVPLGGDSVGDGVATDTDAVPDASRISPPVLLPGYPNPVRLSLTCDIDPAGLPISNIRSSLHAVIESNGTGGRRRIELQPGERLNKDFILRFSIGHEAVCTSLTLAPDEDDAGEGTFTFTLLPPLDRDVKARPRDVVFVLDRSGSMGGWKMVAARRAVARMVDTLNDSDRFSVFAFDHSIETPSAFKGAKLAAATDRNRYRAIEFLSGLEARGGTEMATPLTKATDALAGGYHERDRILVLVTDGQVGNESQILRSLSKRIKNVRVFTLGIDRAVNEGFLKRLAMMGGGACELVESEDRLDEVMDKIHRRIGTPVITELGLQAKGIEIDHSSIVPSRLPDLFAGSPVVIRGRYRGVAEGRIVVKGQDAAGISWEKGVSGVKCTDDLARSIWARGYVRDLEDQYDSGRGNGDLINRITSTSLRFGVLCRFTAFLAVDRSVVVKGDGDPKKVTQAVDAPDGWAMFGADSDADLEERAEATGELLMQSAPMDMMDMKASPMPDMSLSSLAAPPQSATRSRSKSGALGAFARVAAMPVKAAIGVAGAAGGAAKALGRAAGGGSKKRKAAPKPAARAMRVPEPVSKRDQAETTGDFDAYGDRIRHLIEELDRSSSLPARRRTADLAGRLRAMVEDLTSVGAPTTLIDALEKVVVALREALTSGADDAELEKVLAEAAKGLSELASAKKPDQASRREFWK